MLMGYFRFSRAFFIAFFGPLEAKGHLSLLLFKFALPGEDLDSCALHLE